MWPIQVWGGGAIAPFLKIMVATSMFLVTLPPMYNIILAIVPPFGSATGAGAKIMLHQLQLIAYASHF